MEKDGEDDSPSHAFGGEHTTEKLEAVGNYLPAYTTALVRRFTCHYVDAFAGTGVCDITVGGVTRRVQGSASIAMDCSPPFHKMFFVEKSASKALALRKLVGEAPERLVVKGDANIEVPNYLSRLSRSERAVVLLDPYGMAVDWSTLEKIANTKLADVWYLFPLSGLYRQATKDSRDIDEHKLAALNRILGPHEWKKALYEPKPMNDLFGDDSDVRNVDPPRMAQWVRECLTTIFPGVHGPKLLYQRRKDGRQGPPLYALFFLVSNPNPKALELALKFARATLKL